jgi:peptidoglycan/xylan/chitin deacetylase (PgdA/CDA1 family)
MKNTQAIVLCYHEVEDSPALGPYTVSPSAFSEHLNYLSQNNYKTLPLEEYADNYSNIANTTDGTPVIITFDDGHRSQYEKAYPLLCEKNFQATFFITTDYLNKNNHYITQNNLIEMHNNGMEIGGHGQTHSFLDELDKEKLSTELGNSKSVLEEIIDGPIGFFSCPGGRYNKRVIECAGSPHFQQSAHQAKYFSSRIH